MQRSTRLLGATTILVTSCLCACQADIVGPEYRYDDPTIQVPGSGSGGAASGGTASLPPDPGSLAASNGGTAVATGGASSTGGAESAAGGRSAGGGASAGGSSGAAPPAPGGKCDVSGRWAITQRMGVEAFGVREAVRTWFYYELAQSGDAFTVSKGLHCGYDVVRLAPLGANVELKKSFPKIMSQNPHAGRRGTSRVDGSGCAVSFDTIYSVDGATASYYAADLSRPMPGPDDQASGPTPGWEDYDGDGKPGTTYTIQSDFASGKLHVAGRTESTWAGSVPTIGSSFVIASRGNLEEALLGYEGSALLASSYVKTNDPALQFVELARLSDGQATGDDTAICNDVRTLVDSLTPKANEKPL